MVLTLASQMSKWKVEHKMQVRRGPGWDLEERIQSNRHTLRKETLDQSRQLATSLSEIWKSIGLEIVNIERLVDKEVQAIQLEHVAHGLEDGDFTRHAQKHLLDNVFDLLEY